LRSRFCAATLKRRSGRVLIVDQPVDVVAQQIGHVLGVVAQRRHPQRDDVQMRDQIAPERLRQVDRAVEALLRRADPAHVERQRCATADPRVAVLLDCADQRALRGAVRSSSPLMNSVPPAA
jgi:hypothetical protein